MIRAAGTKQFLSTATQLQASRNAHRRTFATSESPNKLTDSRRALWRVYTTFFPTQVPFSGGNTKLASDRLYALITAGAGGVLYGTYLWRKGDQKPKAPKAI